MTYMCEGIPVAVIAEPESELSKTIQAQQLGIVVSPGDANNLARQIAQLYQNSSMLDRMKHNVKQYASKHFQVASVLSKWSSLINKGSLSD